MLMILMTMMTMGMCIRGDKTDECNGIWEFADLTEMSRERKLFWDMCLMNCALNIWR